MTDLDFMADLDWFVQVCDWEFDHLDHTELAAHDMDMGIFEQVGAILSGLGK